MCPLPSFGVAKSGRFQQLTRSGLPRCSESYWGKTGKSVGAPIFAGHAVMNEEQSVGIVSRLDSPQSRIILSPIFALPGAVEVAALRDVGACVRNEFAKFRCC